MQINRKCVNYHLSALKPLRSFGPTQRGPTIDTVLDIKRVKNAFFHSMYIFSVILHTIDKQDISKRSSIFIDQLNHINNASHDSHVRKMAAKLT